MKLLLSWQLSQAPQMDSHLLYAIGRCWFTGGLLLNIICPVLAACSVTENSEEVKATPFLHGACIRMHVKDTFLEILDRS